MRLFCGCFTQKEWLMIGRSLDSTYSLRRTIYGKIDLSAISYYLLSKEQLVIQLKYYWFHVPTELDDLRLRMNLCIKFLIFLEFNIKDKTIISKSRVASIH